MEITSVVEKITGIKTDAVIVPYLEGSESLTGEVADIDKALDGAVSLLISQKEIKGKANEITVIHTLGKMPATRVAIFGLGRQKELNANRVRGAVAEACRSLVKKGVSDAVVVFGSLGVIPPESRALSVTEGAMLGLYTFRRHMTRQENNSEMKNLRIACTGPEKPAVDEGIRKGIITSQAVNTARDMVNEPANFMTPSDMAEAAKKLAAAKGLDITVFEREQMEKMGMGALLGVARGSRQPPKFIVLSYKGAPGGAVIALVGKGITFDSGGISIKPSERMDEMKGDMAGGAAVMAAIGAIAALKPKINVMAVIPATENMPDGNALKPGDILSAMSGKTIEIISTDAEGRLILSDALAYARKQEVSYIVDVATLTGACRVALGDICTGAFGNNQPLMDMVLASAAEAGEYTWQMPMFDEYKELNKSGVADIKNSGGRFGGAISAAKFLGEFVEDTPWVHLDIAGTSLSEKEHDHIIKGATGVPVRTLINLALSLAEKPLK